MLRTEAVAQTTAVVAKAQRFGSGCGMRERTMCLESEIPDLRAKVRVGAAASARTIVATPQAISGASPLCNSLSPEQKAACDEAGLSLSDPWLLHKPRALWSANNVAIGRCE